MNYKYDLDHYSDRFNDLRRNIMDYYVIEHINSNIFSTSEIRKLNVIGFSIEGYVYRNMIENK